MSVTEATAAGLRVGVNNLGQAVVTLPNGKNIVLTSTAAAEEARVQGLANSIAALKDRQLKITVSYYGDASRATSLTGPSVAFAEGGRVRDKIPHLAGGGEPLSGPLNVLPGGRAKGPGTRTSDSILAAISTDEMVTNARDTARNLTELYAINNGQRNYEKYPDTGRPPTGQVAAAQELLQRIKSGGQFFEDFSWGGASANMNANNDALVRAFSAAQTGSETGRWNFDGSTPEGAQRTADTIQTWLEGFIGSATTQAATAAATGAVQAAAPSMVAAASRPLSSTTHGNIVINVYQQPGQDAYAFAQQVGRILELDRKVA
jgi:hypothetical protein